MIAKIADTRVARLGEGPVLFPDHSVMWVDILEGTIWRKAGENPSATWARYPDEISKVLPWADGVLVCGREGVYFVDNTGHAVGSTALQSRESNLRCSDATVAPDGTILVGVIDRDLAPGRSALLRLRLDGRVESVIDGADLSNGIALHPDGHTVVWIDSPSGVLWRFRWDGEGDDRVAFGSVPVELGVPDGLAIDTEGRSYVALWGGSGVLVFDPEGQPDRVIEVGVPHVTSCAFDAADDLVITTASVALSPERLSSYPGAGCLWRVPQAHLGARRQASYVARVLPASE